MSEKAYDASSIQILDGLEAVRKRPGMYIGSTDSRGLHHLVWEIVDNAIDEALNGHGNTIKITIEKDGAVCVEDEGRGMPVGMHEKGISSLEVIFTILHAGGKFSSDGGYKTSGGLHGVGASVVNALSEWVEVTVCSGGKIYQMTFADGGTKTSELKVIGKTNKTGSKVRFKPDKTRFSTVDFSFSLIEERARENAFLLKGLHMIVKDERKDKIADFCYENGCDLTVENVRKQSRFHPRCGTSFIFVILIISIVLSSALALIVPGIRENRAIWITAKVLLLPIVMSLGYEFIRITLPLVMPTVTTFFVLNTLAVFTYYLHPMLLCGESGGGLGVTGTVALQVFQLTQRGATEDAAAFGLLFSLVGIPFIIGIKYFLEKIMPDVEF